MLNQDSLESAVKPKYVLVKGLERKRAIVLLI